MKTQFLEVSTNLILASTTAAVLYGLFMVLVIISGMPIPPPYNATLPASVIIAMLVLVYGFGVFLQGAYLALFHWEK